MKVNVIKLAIFKLDLLFLTLMLICGINMLHSKQMLGIIQMRLRRL